MIWYAVFFLSAIGFAFAITTEVEADEHTLVGRKGRPVPYIFVWCILVFAAGFRFGVGTDYPNYVGLYKEYLTEWLPRLLELDEPGLPVIAKLGSFIFNDYVTMFFFTSLITVGLYVSTIYKYSYSFVFAITLYLIYGEWQHSFNGIRQYLAAAVLFAGYRFLYEKKFWKYLLIVFIAFLFHKSAVFAIFFYFVAKRKFNFTTLLMLIAVAVTIFFSYDFLFDVADEYIDSFWYTDYVVSGMKWQRAAVSMIPLIFYYLIPNEDKPTRENDVMIILCILNSCLLWACIGSRYLVRITYYTQIYFCMAIPLFLGQIEEGKRRVFSLLTIVVLLVFIIIETGQPYYSVFVNPWRIVFKI